MGLAVPAAFFWLPQFSIVIPLILMTLCLVATLEFYDLLNTAGLLPFRLVGALGGVALILATWFGSRYGSPVFACRVEGFMLVGITIAILLRLFPQKRNPKPLETVASTFLGFMYVPFLFNFLTKLLVGWNGSDGRLLVVYMILVVKFTDIGAYFIGCAIGRHKLLPRISPGKSWEGCIGGLAVAVLASWLFYWFSHGNLGVVRFTSKDAVLLGIFLGICGMVGDLTESLFKRAANVKDSSSVILGMGGVLDVLDSLILAAPAFYIYVRLFLEQV